MADSCFVQRLLHYLDITDAEKSAIAKLEQDPTDLVAGRKLWEEGAKSDDICIVQKGWLLSETVLEGGERQILRFYFPGELIGTASIAFDHACSTVRAVQDARLCIFPRARLGELFVEHPRLGTLFYSLGMLEVIDLNDRLRALGRTDGKARLAHLFLSIAERMRVLHGRAEKVLQVPLTQSDLADAVGLTAIHVNRLLKEMTSDGLIRRTRREIELRDEDELRLLSQYRDRHFEVDNSWFPPAST
ncbi:Crp/Fnr family transcriptional regulator [Novosphingopyxis sp.]|uniref:Crp/Fnr family transcriptional regulator n=1 Tax=Novosphingopyxis sp. TaxID=2709690 RepID=UPI003B5C6292